MGWRNWLEERSEVVLTVLKQAAGAAYSMQAFDWSDGKCRPWERDTADLIRSLVEATEGRKPVLPQLFDLTEQPCFYSNNLGYTVVFPG